MSYQLNWKMPGLYINYFNTISISTICNASIEVFGDSRSDRLQYIISDFSDVDKNDVHETQTDIPAIVDKAISIRINKIKMAFVAKDDLLKTLCTKYIDHSVSLENPWEFQLFDTIDEARQWVGA